MVVDVANERVLDRHSPSGHVEIALGRVEGLVNAEAVVDGHEFIAQLIVGGVQRHRKRHGDSLASELVDRGHQPDGRDGHVACREPESERSGRDERAHGRHDRLVVGERLPHAHEDDVRQPHRIAAEDAVTRRPRGKANLLDDLGGRQVPREAHLPRRAERAGHPATGLARDAQRRALRVLHEHRLDLDPVVQGPQRLDRRALVRLEACAPGS